MPFHGQRDVELIIETPGVAHSDHIDIAYAIKQEIVLTRTDFLYLRHFCSFFMPSIINNSQVAFNLSKWTIEDRTNIW